MTKNATQRQAQPRARVRPDATAGVQDVHPASMRRFPRYPTACPATCFVDGRERWDVIITDASQGGFGLSQDLPVPRGTHVIISIPQIGDFLCAVVWKKDGRCGVELASESGWLTDVEAKRLASGLERVDAAGRHMRTASDRTG